MANPIKYTNATQSNSIKTSNFAIGVNNGGYGPTNITNFYNGKTPNVGGYTVYVSNGVGSPSVFVAGNDANLITLSNQLGGSGITTISAALNFFNSSTTMLCTNMDYPNIVTSGLVLNLDAAYTPSYPKNGTTWTDLSGNGNNGTLVNGPSYSSIGGGSIVFDGIDDYVNLGNTALISDDFCIILWFKTLSNKTHYYFSSGYNSQPTILIWSGGVWIGGTALANQQNIGNTMTGNPVCVVVNRYNKESKVYLNNILQSTNTVNVVLRTDSLYTIGHAIPRNNTAAYFHGEFYTTQVYNRSLTEQEILQNYYAGLQRFIPTDGLVLSLDAQNTNRRISNPTVANDMSGNNYNGNMMNGTALSIDGGTSFSFDGTNDYIDIGVRALLLPQSLTVSVWFKISISQLSQSSLIRSRTYGWGISITGNTLSSFLYTSVSNQIISTGSTISLNVYNHVSITYTSSTFRMYLNGVQVYTTTSPTNSIYYVNGYVGIARDADAPGSYLTGNISSLQIHNRALTATEISTIYTATKSRYGL